MNAVLVNTLGTTWLVVPEIFAFTNPDSLPARRSRGQWPRSSLPPVEAIWVVTTQDRRTQESLGMLRQWAKEAGVPLKAWWVEGIDDVDSEENNRYLADLIYRVVLCARQAFREVYLSLAGGRKTMSAELQQAGYVFGMDALLHVLDMLHSAPPEIRKQHQELTPEIIARELPSVVADYVEPVVLSRRVAPLAVMEAAPSINSEQFPLPPEGAVTGSDRLYCEVQRALQNSSQAYAHLVADVVHTPQVGSFRAVYVFSPRLIRTLQHLRIGADPEGRQKDRQWLRMLPKAELHCHLGGLLSPKEMVEVAGSCRSQIESYRNKIEQYRDALDELRKAVENADTNRLNQFLGENTDRWKRLRKRWPGVPEPFGVAGFLLVFEQAEELLDELIYGPFRDSSRFRGVGFATYESLGDLQGSGLLQCEETLRAALRILRNHCREDNIRYLELRCSPWNYTRGSMSEDEVIEVLLDESSRFTADGVRPVDLRLIFIASRHRRMEKVKEHIRLVRKWLGRDSFRQRFVGFDLAGDERALPPSRLRDEFLPLMENVVRITVHAGEGVSVKNVWEAVYHLCADRVGHGLSLAEDCELMSKLRDRAVAIELCPSSNDQIVGYGRDCPMQRDGQRPYPLRLYMESGIRTTINTDNPGISRTSLSDEFLRAADITPGGLTRWEVLHLIRNGFRAAFCSYDDRQRLIRQAESELVPILNAQHSPVP
ncbi:MAG: hypothetical protein KatS3mg110_0172 [Pirellulaceae bacterium]|nr:MAG: hypothetical protein KatS3mg110_0172 [Pirellulaceae bacterium]